MDEPVADLSAESAEDLVEMTTWANDPKAAKAARTELWERFRPYVWTACERAYGENMRRGALFDLVIDTFARAFERAATFKNDNLRDHVRAFRKVGAWLCAIAKNLAKDKVRGESITIVSPEQAERERRRRPASSRLGPLARRVRDALTTPGVLGPNEIVVLKEWAEHYDPDREQQRFPDGVTDELAKQLNVQPESIRQILRRGLLHLRSWLESDQSSTERIADAQR